MVEYDVCVKARCFKPTPSVFIKLGQIVDAYLILCEISGMVDFKGVKVLNALKGIEPMCKYRTSLKDVTAIYAYAIAGAITSSFLQVSGRFVELQGDAEELIVRLRDLIRVENVKVSNAMFPEDLIEILRIRLKLRKDSDESPYVDLEGWAVSEILSRVQSLRGVETLRRSQVAARTRLEDRLPPCADCLVLVGEGLWVQPHQASSNTAEGSSIQDGQTFLGLQLEGFQSHLGQGLIGGDDTVVMLLATVDQNAGVTLKGTCNVRQRTQIP